MHIIGNFRECFVVEKHPVPVPVGELIAQHSRNELTGLGMWDRCAYLPSGLPDLMHTQVFAGVVELTTTSLGGAIPIWGNSEDSDTEFTYSAPNVRKGVYALFGTPVEGKSLYVYAHEIDTIPEAFRSYLIAEPLLEKTTP